MNTKTSEKITHLVITWGVVLLGSVIGGAAIVFLSGYALFALIGNVSTAFTDGQIRVLYGMLSLIAVHLCTGGWWMLSCMKFIDEMNALHVHQLSRLEIRQRKAVGDVVED